MTDSLLLPALQGQFGSWLYYTALMSLADLKERVSYATEIYQNRNLGDQIQRRLDNKTRKKEIAEFLLENKDRFFNALVVGVHGGDPQWHPFDVGVKNQAHKLDHVRQDDREAVGYLELSGGEKLFALDGQHRLAGVREALTQNPDLGRDRVSVVFVSARLGENGLRRTRDLFIMLNKRAVPVKKPDIIALDEVDLAAIITRRLADTHPWFSRGQVEMKKYGHSIPKGDRQHLTTLGNLYEVVKIAIRGVMAVEEEEELSVALRLRLPENRIDHYEKLVVKFFKNFSKLDPILEKYFATADRDCLDQARRSTAPHVLFRPIGLFIFAKVLAELRKKFTLSESFERLGSAPILLTASSYEGLIWNSQRGIIVSKGRSIAERLLAYQLGADVKLEKLRTQYAEFRGATGESVRLPPRLIT